MREDHPGDRRTRLVAGSRNLGLEFVTVAAPGTRSGMHRCPPTKQVDTILTLLFRANKVG
jgi:hypothetical protein